jgi:hypothetical protein
MTQQHPITPPPELVQRLYGLPQMRAIEAAFQAGADWELEACCEWMAGETPPSYLNALRAARRPKPPSLKEQALDELDRIPTHDSEGRSVGVDVSILRRALEQLPAHE